MEATVNPFLKLMERWILCIKNNPDWRLGQALMNALYEVDKGLSKIVTDEYVVDCYYQDERIRDTLLFVFKYYSEQEAV